MKNISEADNKTLFRRLDEIEDKFKDWFISAYQSDNLYKEKEMIIEELENRGYRDIRYKK